MVQNIGNFESWDHDEIFVRG